MSGGRDRRAVCVWLCAVLAACPSVLAAQPRAERGLTASGLSGLDRIHLPLTPAPAVAVAASAGYGFIESQGGVDGAHHRAVGVLGIGAAVLDWLAFGLRFDSRHDAHPDDGMGSDSGTVGDPRLLARAGVALDEQLQLGAELALWLPGENAPSLALDASTLDARVLLAHAPHDSAWTVAGTVGYRFDQSARAAPDLERLRAGDRLALGLSEFDALLLGLGVLHRGGALELLGEAGLDLLIGSNAPGLGQSPIRITAGARYHMSSALQLALQLAVSPSGRPSQTGDDPLLPIEPRLSLQAGVRYRFGAAATAAPDDGESAARDSQPARGIASAASTATVSGRLLDEQGAAIAGARVSLTGRDHASSSETDAEGRYAFADVPAGEVELAAEHEGHEPRSWRAAVSAGVATLADQVLARVVAGQLRGLALSFRGQPVAAQIRVSSREREDAAPVEVTSGANGRFQIDLPPGRYEVRVSARGYEPQTRQVEVAADGVVILNLDLRKAAP